MGNLFRNSRRKISQGLLFWREIGVGAPIIFLHGAWDDSSQWLSVMDLLGQNFHCFAPDLLGFGESEYPHVHYSVDLQVECLRELLQALNLERVTFVGHSLGGWVAASYALKYPEQVSSLVLLAPEGVATEGYQKRCQKIQALVQRAPWMFKLLRLLTLLTKVVGFKINFAQDWQQKQMIDRHSTASQMLFLRQLPEIAAELLQDKLDVMKAPTLILQGRQDEEYALNASKAYAYFIPKAEYKIIAHGDNQLPRSCAAVVAGDIQDFIQQYI
ncbi:alpha/beta fold hydrolase [Calothrix rhizosoleniae]|uniref:alpha/beta fold hydrolase n=1 Tax=Calothrix rhizosoleniae TaxID=888997 RepID=UPI000B4A236A|nr:alpha/beta hydrolase [Calothrix rhizosoleniae]